LAHVAAATTQLPVSAKLSGDGMATAASDVIFSSPQTFKSVLLNFLSSSSLTKGQNKISSQVQYS
jgi:hypothetical protein